jgi:hypothetical protein
VEVGVRVQVGLTVGPASVAVAEGITNRVGVAAGVAEGGPAIKSTAPTMTTVKTVTTIMSVVTRL